MLYYILYPLSVLLLLWNIFYRFLITSDIPPSFSAAEMRDFYISSALMVIFFILTIQKVGYHAKKILFVFIPVVLIMLFFGYGFIHNMINYVYYNKSMFFMDLTLIIELLLILGYSLYQLKMEGIYSGE